MTDSATPLGWWAISGDSLLAMLRRAHDGEDPDLIYAEEYANSDHEQVKAARCRSCGAPVSAEFIDLCHFCGHRKADREREAPRPSVATDGDE